VSVACPAQFAPDDIVKPPSGPHELIEVGGGAGSGATCKHPAEITTTAATTISNAIRDIPTPAHRD